MNPPSTTVKRRMVRIGHLTNAMLIKLLSEGTYQCKELAEMTGLHYITVLEYMRAMHKVGAVHIHSWEKDSRGRDVIKIYKLGAGMDAKRHRMTDVEKTARWRDKKRVQQMALVMGGKGKFVKSKNGGIKFEGVAA